MICSSTTSIYRPLVCHRLKNLTTQSPSLRYPPKSFSYIYYYKEADPSITNKAGLLLQQAASGMGENTRELADHGPCSHSRKILTCSLLATFALSLIYFIFYSPPSSLASYTDLLNQFKTQRTTKNTALPPPQGNYSSFSAFALV